MSQKQKSFMSSCANLRRKIADAGVSGVVIDNIRGQGYISRDVRDYDKMTISA